MTDDLFLLLFKTWQIYGPESSGKTTLALHAIAEVQVWNPLNSFLTFVHVYKTVKYKCIGMCMGRGKSITVLTHTLLIL